MKNIISKSSLSACLFAMILMPAFMSCKKDPKPTLRDEVVGDWKIKSFTVDGVELKGSLVLASKMEFDAYTGSNGDFEWSVNYTDGSSEIISGDYTVDVEDKEIVLENEEGQQLKFDLDIVGDKLEMTGIIDGERYELEADRD